MPQWTPQKNDVLSSIARQALQHYRAGRFIVAVDGVDAAGKSHFGDELGDTIRAAGSTVVRASVDGFHSPRATRYARGADSPEGFYLDSYDYEAFRRLLIDPFRAGASVVTTAAFDHRTDAAVTETVTDLPDDAVLVLDGIFLHRAPLRGLWNFSIWLDVPAGIAEERLRGRDGDDGVSERYSRGQAIYVSECRPSAAATVIVDNTDFDRPRQVFADSC